MPDDPSSEISGEVGGPAAPVSDAKLTETQRQILLALCRHCMGESRYATPATNQQIAGEVYLSIDAVKAHLRALYRKFGVEPLPHNQKRVRLVELVLEGGYLGPVEPGADGEGGGGAGGVATAPVPDAAPGPAPTPSAPAGGGPPRRLLIGLGAILALAAAAGLIALITGGGDEEPAEAALSKAEHVEAVNADCTRALGQLDLIGERRLSEASTGERAGTYLSVIETMRGSLGSQAPPAGDDRALARFEAGLERAATFTRRVAEVPPEPGSPEGANIVAELTFAAGQVQAGAVGYGLGADCSAIGNLVASSARNAAGTP
jgi:DNA-binding CsgD family transcriptional regulator